VVWYIDQKDIRIAGTEYGHRKGKGAQGIEIFLGVFFFRFGFKQKVRRTMQTSLQRFFVFAFFAFFFFDFFLFSLSLEVLLVVLEFGLGSGVGELGASGVESF
jgi:hypothetical protein